MRLSASIACVLTCAYLQVSFCLVTPPSPQGVNKAQESLIRSLTQPNVELRDLPRINTERSSNDYLAVLLYLQYLESLKSQINRDRIKDVSIKEPPRGALNSHKNTLESAGVHHLGKLGHVRGSHATPTRSDKNHHGRLINIATHPMQSPADQTHPFLRVSQPPAATHLRNTPLTADIRSRDAPFHLRVVPPHVLLRQEVLGGKKGDGGTTNAKGTQRENTQTGNETPLEKTQAGKKTHAEKTPLEKTQAVKKTHAKKTHIEETQSEKGTHAEGTQVERARGGKNRHGAEKPVADPYLSRGVSSDPVPRRRSREVATSRQFSGPPFDLLPRLIAALDNPAVVVLLLILNVSES